MKNLKAPTIVTTAILTVITIMFWTAFELFRIFTLKPAPPVAPEIVTPVSPNIDLDSLNKIQSRIFLSDQEIPAQSLILVTPAPTSPPLASPVASPSSEATGSASPVPTTLP